MLWRAAAQDWVNVLAPEAGVAELIRLGIPLLSIVGSALLFGLGRERPLRALAVDAVSLAVLLVLLFGLSLAPLSRDGIGILFVLAVLARVGPAIWVVVREDRGALAAFAVAFALYAPLAAWVTVSAAPYGDQVHYLLAADRLAAGSLDATFDDALFRDLIGADPGPSDTETHVITPPTGPRSVQGPWLPALLLPGWLLAGRLGAHLVVAAIAALAAAQLWLLLREVVPVGRAREVSWMAVTFLAPVLPMATHLYPNALGALLGVTAYRFAFTRTPALPAGAGALLGATLLLTPRDGLLLLALAPFALLPALRAGSDRAADLRNGRQFAAGLIGVALIAVVANAVVYGVPLPYAGYLYGTAAAQALEQEPSLSLRFWVGLPAILFDRTHGLAAVAPGAFVALAGIGLGLREHRARLLPALVAIAVTLGALSIFRYWEGGYAPPARYLVEVMPLVAPFLAFGLTVVRWWLSLALLGLGALATLVLAAIPTVGLNSAFEHKLREQLGYALGTDPLGWLPSFQPTAPDWYLQAYLRLLPALLAVGVLLWLGRVRARA